MNWAIEYFVNGDSGLNDRPAGWHILAPYSGCPAPPGYARHTANSRAEVDQLERTLNRQMELDLSREAENDYNMREAAYKGVRDAIVQKIANRKDIDESFRPYITDFLRELLKMKAGHPRRQYFENQLECFIAVRHNNIGNRKPNEEIVDRDAIAERAGKL